MARDQLKLMESAIVLAEELHLSRAARRLKISQPRSHYTDCRARKARGERSSSTERNKS